MREILFRGKRIDNGNWVEGGLISGVFTALGQDIKYILCPDKADYDCFEDFSEENGIFEVIHETVGQYTGLTDKNGTKIFEGDIVRLKRFGNIECGKIVFNTNTAGFEFWHEVTVGAYGEKSTRKENLCAFAVAVVEVIGNIHDNPELLEGVRNG